MLHSDLFLLTFMPMSTCRLVSTKVHWDEKHNYPVQKHIEKITIDQEKFE